MSRSFGLSASVEAYVRAANPDEPPALKRCRLETQANADAPAMQISPEQGAFMALIAKLIGAKTYYEVGVFTGYSMLAVALAMQQNVGEDAQCIGFERSADFIDIARGYWKEAGVDSMIEMRMGDARATLPNAPSGSADLIFIDADKTGYSAYLREAKRLLRRGGLVMADNVLWEGDVADATKTNAEVTALRTVAKDAKADDDWDVAFTSIGDGLLLCRRR